MADPVSGGHSQFSASNEGYSIRLLVGVFAEKLKFFEIFLECAFLKAVMQGVPERMDKKKWMIRITMYIRI